MRPSSVSLVAALAAAFSSGCVVQESITLENVDITGPQSSAPVHITNDSVKSVRAAVHFNRNSSPRLTSSSQMESVARSLSAGGRISSSKVNWVLPEYEGGVDLDLPLSQSVSLSFGASVTDISQGFAAGIGFHGEGLKSAWRWDLGFQWQTVSYDIDYVLTTKTTTLFSESEKSEDRHDNGSQTHANFFTSLTFNTKNPLGAVNFFVQLGFVRQTVFDYEEKTLVFPVFGWSGEESLNSTIIFVTPGIYFDLSKSMRVIGGARFCWDAGLMSDANWPLITPVLIFDLGL